MYKSKNENVAKKSAMRKHAEDIHDNSNDLEFEMEVMETFRYDALGRQVCEGVMLREEVAEHIMNSKEEFRQPGEIICTYQQQGSEVQG